MRLLIIDDEEDICELIAEVGARHGLEARTISNAEEVHTLLAEFTPDIIMMDLMMPGVDGVELLRLLSDKAKNAKLCLISGSDTRVLNSARRLGSAHGLDVVEALEKPISLPTLNNFFDKVAKATPQPKIEDHAMAIATGQFTLHYQPVVSIGTRDVKGVEALARWQHPEHGLLLPDRFLDNVTTLGLMQVLTDFVIENAVTQVGKWVAQGEKLTMAINVTASALLDLALPDKIADLCKQHNVPTNLLILEVTESEAMRDVTRTMDVLLRIRLRNIGVSIDDFGTGHSSLRELQRMPFNELKIDKSFVSDMARNRDSAVIINSIIDLGHNLGLKVIAEGIEDRETWDSLKEKGCDFGQGYFMGRPMQVSEFATWLENWRKG